MKKQFIKNVTKFLLICLILFFYPSCSSSDDKETPVIPMFTKMDASENDVFTDKPITLTIEGKYFTDIQVTSNNSSVIIKKVTTSTYEITSPVAGATNITADLINGSNKYSKTISLNFHEHGIKDVAGTFEVEGIKRDDNSSKVFALLGEPDRKTKATNSSYPDEYWIYPSKGLLISMNYGGKSVSLIKIYSKNYSLENMTDGAFADYPNEILYSGWKIDDPSTTIDALVKKLGTSQGNFYNYGYGFKNYSYNNKTQSINFIYANDATYIGKTIKFIYII